jgi:hypothetical protein
VALGLTLLLTWPLARDATRAMPANGEPMDALLQSWVLHWDWLSLDRDPARVFDAPIFHPERRTLTYMDHLLGQARLGWPVWRATGNVALAYDGVLVVAFVATAWAVYRFARALAVSRAAAFLAAFAYTFGAYRLSNLGNLNQLSTQWVALGAFFAARYLARRRPRDLVLALATLGIQAWFGWYYVFHLVVALGLAIAVAGLGGRRRLPPGGRGRHALALAAGVTAAALIAWPVTWPYLEQRAGMEAFQRSLGSASLYSADLLDYLRIHRESALAGWMPWRAGGQAYWPGLAVVLLAALGARAWMGDRRSAEPPRAPWAFVAGTTLAGFVLSLGPLLIVAGHRLPIPLPYAALHLAVPGFAAMRAPGRYAELVLLGLVAVAALGLDRLVRGRTPRARAGWIAACWIVAIAESVSMPLRMVPYPDPGALPEVGRWLARQPGRLPILELPMPASEEEERPRDLVRQIHGLAHGHPRVDGVSGFTPPAHRRLRAAMTMFPADSALALARAHGAALVIVHAGEIEEPIRARMLEEIARTPALEPVARFGDDHVLRLR